MKVIRRGRPRHAVGYIRVSTEGQARDGLGLEQQTDIIRLYAEQHGILLNGIYDDVASGTSGWSPKDRPGLHVAVAQARSCRGFILVARLNRMSRDGRKFIEFWRSTKVRIVSTVPSENDSFKTSVSAVENAAKVRSSIVEGTKRTLEAKKAKGVVLGNAATLPAARKSSWKQRSIASHMKVLEIRDFILKHSEHGSWTVAEVAKRLNEVGIFSGRNLPWNKHSLRRQLRLAKEELKLLVEVDVEEW